MPAIETVVDTYEARNREAWLTELSRQVQPLFSGYQFKPYRVTCGWPMVSGRPSGKGYRVGECHGERSSKAGVFELFISPTLDKPLEVAGVVMHELAHVLAGTDAKHGKRFVDICNHAGLTHGPATSRGPGKLLEEVLRKEVAKLGPYPHKAVIPVARMVKPGNTVGLRCVGCGCKCSMSRKWVAEAGLPTCGCGVLMEVKEK